LSFINASQKIKKRFATIFLFYSKKKIVSRKKSEGREEKKRKGVKVICFCSSSKNASSKDSP
jgi:hypothetical protein